MKKIDKLILKAFFGPFLLTLAIVVFILLVVHISKYFDELVGKNLGVEVFGELMFYFALFNTPVALPLAVLLSSLMTFGNLGEHMELVAIKSSGISLTRALRPIFIFVIFLTVVAFFNNNYLVPKAALNAYSLIYDIKQQKPALDIREGTFYNGIPNFSIKVKEKLPDNKTLKDLIIYDHSEGLGNREVIVADSGMMYTILNERYLKLELYNGNHYQESTLGKNRVLRNDEISPFTRTKFDKSQIVFDLSSFDLKRSDKEIFANDRLTRNFYELGRDVDSIQNEIHRAKYEVFDNGKNYFTYHLKNDIEPEIPPYLQKFQFWKDSLEIMQIVENIRDTVMIKSEIQAKKEREQREDLPKEKYLTVDTLFKVTQLNQLKAKMYSKRGQREASKHAVNVARQIKSRLSTQNTRMGFQNENHVRFSIQYHKMVSFAFACMVMFFIGAPLGAIIKKGGLGFPVLMCITFFIIFYSLFTTGENWAKEGRVQPIFGVWLSNIILFPIGLFFLRQARHDVRLFDTDFYYVVYRKLIRRITGKKKEVQEIETSV